MNTKLLLILSSIYLLIGGVLFSFLPNEIIANLNYAENPIFTLTLQLLGALYLGFALLNWLKRTALIGGIYNRPIVFANFMHFFVGFFALAKITVIAKEYYTELLVLSIIYFIFSSAFAFLFFKNPKKIDR